MIFFLVCNKPPNWRFKNQAQINTANVNLGDQFFLLTFWYSSNLKTQSCCQIVIFPSSTLTKNVQKCPKMLSMWSVTRYKSFEENQEKIKRKSRENHPLCRYVQACKCYRWFAATLPPQMMIVLKSSQLNLHNWVKNVMKSL